MGLSFYSSSDLFRKSIFLKLSKALVVCLGLPLFAGMLFSFTYENTSTENPHSQLLSNDLFTSDPYFVLEENPGKFRMVKAVFSDYELLLRPDMLEYFATNNGDDLAHFVFEECNQNIQPNGVNLISSEKVPIKNKVMAEVIKTSSMEVSIYEKVVYNNIYDNLDLEISDDLSFDISIKNK